MSKWIPSSTRYPYSLLRRFRRSWRVLGRKMASRSKAAHEGTFSGSQFTRKRPVPIFSWPFSRHVEYSGRIGRWKNDQKSLDVFRANLWTAKECFMSSHCFDHSSRNTMCCNLPFFLIALSISFFRFLWILHFMELGTFRFLFGKIDDVRCV